MALEVGVPAKTHILDFLHRLIDGKSIAASVVDAPQALNLANVNGHRSFPDCGRLIFPMLAAGLGR
jgi:hypothetical protein